MIESASVLAASLFTWSIALAIVLGPFLLSLAFDGVPSVVGAFLWKWFPEPYPVGRNFQLATPALTRTIADVWR